jgi:hypothetical protein
MALAPRLVVSSRLAAFVATIWAIPAFSTVALAAAPQETKPGGVPEPAPEAGAIPGETTAPAVPEPSVPGPGAESSGPEAEPTGPEPEAEPTQPPPGDVVPVEPVAAPAVDPTLLDAPEPEDAKPVRPVATEPASRSPEEQLAALDDAYAARYRPPENPLRLNIAGRVMFANISGRERVNGRMGGGAIDIGPAWNRVGVAATLTGFAGRVQLPPATGAELNGLLGGGVTVGLGRLALLSHGFLDLRLGYDVFYGVVNQRADAAPIVTSDDGSQVLAPAQNLAPHGPRARLDLGLMGVGNGRFFHGFGLSMGYQALLGSVRGDMPMTSMLTVGLSYWMG